MFHSIRWRLITSYVFLTLLAVGAMGLLALWSVNQYAQQKENEFLMANARAVAQQASPLLSSMPMNSDLVQLTQAAAFFGNVRVQILDTRRNVIADSGQPGGANEFAWVILSGPESGLPAELMPEGLILAMPSIEIQKLSRPEQRPPLIPGLPAKAKVTVIQQMEGPWGSLLYFESQGVDEPASPAIKVPDTDRPSRSQHSVQVPIEQEGQVVGYVKLSSGTDYGAEALNTTRRAFFIAGTGALLLAGLFGFVMGSRFTAPVRNLTQAAARMRAGDLTARAAVESPDEIGALALQFNQMAGELQISFSQLGAERDALRRFIADASHELRTPITALRNFNDLLLGAAAEDMDARVEFLNENQKQIDRLAWITQNLLDLSRLEAGLTQLNLADLDLSELFQAASLPFWNQAADKGITLAIHPLDPPISVRADRERLISALSNLLDNALKFTPPGGTVELGALSTGDIVQIWVRDNGPGIKPEALPHIFKRFYRGQEVTVPGSGLGLAIVESIVEAHQGRVWVESEPGQGARFVLEWKLK